jgi:hypothetical protein
LGYAALARPVLIFHLFAEYNAPRRRPSGMLFACNDPAPSVGSRISENVSLAHQSARAGVRKDSTIWRNLAMNKFPSCKSRSGSMSRELAITIAVVSSLMAVASSADN